MERFGLSSHYRSLQSRGLLRLSPSVRPFESPGLNMPPAFLDSSYSFDYNFKFYSRDGEIRSFVSLSFAAEPRTPSAVAFSPSFRISGSKHATGIFRLFLQF